MEDLLLYPIGFGILKLSFSSMIFRVRESPNLLGTEDYFFYSGNRLRPRPKVEELLLSEILVTESFLLRGGLMFLIEELI